MLSPVPEETSCSPIAIEKKRPFCFPRPILEKLAEHAGIKIPKRISNSNLWNMILKNKKTSKCAPLSIQKAPACVAHELGATHDPTIRQYIRPFSPAEWKETPRTWLTNIDIQRVMEQYAAVPSKRYNFLGVFPIDFAKKEKDGFERCVVSELCKLDWKSLTRNGTADFIGMITNLDKHDEPGSHWTSLFAVINPKYPCFGVYYYDSGRSSRPREIIEFMDNLETLVQQKFKHQKCKCKKQWNNIKQHQFKNTECGMFAMMYQLRWLQLLEKDPQNTTFEQVVNVNWDDEIAFQHREKMFIVNACPAPPGHKGNRKIHNT
jgi:hypothetical protein